MSQVLGRQPAPRRGGPGLPGKTTETPVKIKQRLNGAGRGRASWEAVEKAGAILCTSCRTSLVMPDKAQRLLTRSQCGIQRGVPADLLKRSGCLR